MIPEYLKLQNILVYLWHMENSLKEATEIVKVLQKNGFVAYFAGGTVRDMLLGKESPDIDIATSATPDEIEKLFEKTIPIGKSFGVIIVNQGGTNFEVATFRKEAGYLDRRRPQSVSFTEAKEDAIRRDFTINGMFYDPVAKKTIDYVGGEEDIKKRTVRFIGDPNDRINEDNLRLLRAIRFKTTLGFQYEQMTFEAVRSHSSLIKNVSAERIRDELDKIMANKNRHLGLIELSESGLLREILPEVENLKEVPQPVQFHKEGDVFVHIYLALKALEVDGHSHLAWAILLHDIAKPQTLIKEGERIIFHDHAEESAKVADKILTGLKFPNYEKNEIVWLVENHMKIAQIDKMRPYKKYLFVSNPKFNDLTRLAKYDALGTYPQDTKFLKTIEAQAQKAIEWGENQSKKVSAFISGDDLIKLGLEPSEKFKKILEDVNELHLEDKFASKEEAMSYIKEKYLK